MTIQLNWIARHCCSPAECPRLLGYRFALHRCSSCLISIWKVTAFPRPPYTRCHGYGKAASIPLHAIVITPLAVDKERDDEFT
jgi:hypothetical protein